MTIKPGIEFSICTYNRSAFLKGCIESLLKQMIPDTTLITVIDNNSTDDTRNWVLHQMSQYPCLRYIVEPQQGLSIARNTAWGEAIFEWILYLDDDSVPPAGFVNAALDLTEHFKTFEAFGGPIKAVYKDAIPKWLPEEFGSFAMPFHQVTQIDKGFVRGPCMLIKRHILEKLGGFNQNLGVKGNSLRYGEEIELQMRMRKAGFKIGYAPSLQIAHFVRTEKTGIFWILRSEYARRRDKMLFDPISLPMATLHLCRTILGRLIWTPVHLYRLFFSKPYSYQEAVYDILKPMAYRAGEWVGVVMNTFRLKSSVNQQ
jgi:GT2 family glycosyltransferase